MAEIKRVDQSPMNAQRWCLTLDCGHDQWVTAKRRPTRKTIKCSKCADLERRRANGLGAFMPPPPSKS